MNLLQSFKDFINDEKLFHQQDQLLLAVSGGLDSVVLCELCQQAGFNFSIAHCNFQLRADESDRDETFVKELANKYKVHYFVKKFDTSAYTEAGKMSIQEAARELRYKWFNELVEKEKQCQKPVWLLTAHHADDNIETQLMNLFKGTGINGLRGIEPKRNFIVRPLLFSSRSELLSFAESLHLKWVEDSSNALDKYSRNYFRHQVIPLIEKIYPNAVENLRNNIPRFREVSILYQQAISYHKKKLLVVKGNEIHIPILKIKKTIPLHTVLFEIIEPFGFKSKQVAEVEKLLDSETGKFVYSNQYRIIKHRKWLIIAPGQDEQSNIFVIADEKSQVDFEGGHLSFKLLEKNPGESTERTVCLDAKNIDFPFILRKWKTGDYFYPLGMEKKKKISRFLIDQKISKTGKENVWVLEMNKKIIWVVGMRIDNRFKLTPQTSSFLRISLSK